MLYRLKVYWRIEGFWGFLLWFIVMVNVFFWMKCGRYWVYFSFCMDWLLRWLKEFFVDSFCFIGEVNG